MLKKVFARAGENTFEAIAREWHENKKSAWTERYAEDVLERIASNIFPYLGHRPINEISPPELVSVLRKIEARGAFYQANRLRESCSLVFRYAIATGRAERDTAADLRGALKSQVTTSRAAMSEPEEVGGLLRAIDGYTDHFVTTYGLHLTLTFLRPGEVRLGEWSEIDLKEKLWRIPAKCIKMRRDHLVPLSAQACAILEELHELTRRGRLMFPGLRSLERAISDATFIAALGAWALKKMKCAPTDFARWQAPSSTSKAIPLTPLKSSLPTIRATRYAGFTTVPSIYQNAGR